jgi:hypothetical protein
VGWRSFSKSFFVLATSMNVVSNCGDFSVFSQNMTNVAKISKKLFVGFAHDFILSQ